MPLLAFSLLLAVAAAISDFRWLRIPNAMPAGIALSFLAFAALDGMPLVTFGAHLGVAALLLAICIGLFAIRALGGGDGKLIAALALWAGPELIIPFLLYTTLIGGALAVATLKLDRLPLPACAYSIGWLAATGKGRSIPYGIAIALGAIATFWSQIV